MKVEFKQSFEIDKQEFKITKKGKPGIAEMPGYFIFIPTFISLAKDGLVKILEFSEKEEELLPEKYKDKEPDSFIMEMLKKVFKDESEEASEDEEEENSEEGDKIEESNSPASSDSSLPPAEEVKNEGESNEMSIESNAEEVEISDDAKGEEPSEDQKEYDSLHEKAKRLNNKEKKRYEELKAKLGIKE